MPMTGPPPPPRRQSVVAITMLTTAFITVLTVVAACTAEPAPDLKPAEASDRITKTMQLTPETGACLRKAFDAKPDVVSALNADEQKQASAKRVDEFMDAVRPCLTREVLADAYPKFVAAGFTVNVAQRTCISQAILALDDAKRDVLIKLGVGVPTHDIAFGTAETNELLRRCKIQEVAVPNPGQPVGPDGGATNITR